ncbi:hypothetical protein Dimus_010843, partial [Dionaea muscipula]
MSSKVVGVGKVVSFLGDGGALGSATSGLRRLVDLGGGRSTMEWMGWFSRPG